jgi:hypothetical protein
MCLCMFVYIYSDLGIILPCGNAHACIHTCVCVYVYIELLFMLTHTHT